MDTKRSKTSSYMSYLIEESKKTRKDRYQELNEMAKDDRAYDLECERNQAIKEIEQGWDMGQEG
jgi:hypothetical protein